VPAFFGEGKTLLTRTRLAKIYCQHLDLNAMRRPQFSAWFRKPLPRSGREHKMRAPRRKFLRDHPGALATAQSTVSPGEDSGQKSELGKVMRPVLPVAVDNSPSRQ
jgi:hypothetical protein